MRRTLFRLFLGLGAAALLALSGAQALAATPQAPGARLMTSEYLAQAAALLDQGKADEAWTMLIRLVREEPENISVNLLLARAGFASGRDNQALAALERLTALQPNNAGLHLTLARAYARAGDAAGAQAEMEEARRLDPALADESEETALKKTAKSASTRYDRFLVAGRLALGMLWDSNPTGGLDSLNVDIGPYTFRLGADAGRKKSWGEYVNGALTWGWRLGEVSPWYLAGDAAFYGKNYTSDLASNKHFTWGRASVGLRRVAARHLADVRAHVENAIYDPFDSMTAAGGDASYIFAFLPSLQLIAKGVIDHRDYQTHHERNGTYYHGGLYGRLLLGKGNSHSILLGGRVLGANAREKRHSYEGYEASLRLDFNLFDHLDVSPWVAGRRTRYRDAAMRLAKLLGEGRRKDTTWMAGTTLTWHWTDHLATELGWQYVKNKSNSPFYRYDQQQVNMGLVLSF